MKTELELTVLEGLKQAIRALSQVPNFRLKGDPEKTSYDLLAQLGDVVERAESEARYMRSSVNSCYLR